MEQADKEDIEFLYKATIVNTNLLWSAVTFSIVAAVNSLISGVIFKWLVFMIIALISLILKNRWRRRLGWTK